MIERYASPNAFKQALEQRLRTASGGGTAFARKRQRLIFERFLARVAATLGETVTLKGGLVLELRLQRARTTNDVDLRMAGAPVDVLVQLQRAARYQFDDFLTYEIVPDAEHPDITNPGMRHEGMRFRAECRLAGKPYGLPFGVDVAFGDPMLGTPDLLTGDDTLSFAGVPPLSMRVYPVTTHLAEKLHAYTLPRSRPNSRVKDLPDLALLATVHTLDAQLLRSALEKTFSFRQTHPLPSALPPPSAGWQAPYAALARENQLRWTSLSEVTMAATNFLDPVLRGDPVTTWSPDLWVWT